MEEEHRKSDILYAAQKILSDMDENEMLGTIVTFLSWEIATRTLNINEILWAFNMAVNDGVRQLLGIKKWEDE